MTAAIAPITPRAVLGALTASAAEHTVVATGDGDLTTVLLTIDDRPVLVVASDYAVRHGSIGTLEADQLVGALRTARASRWGVVLLLETSGIRVTDGTAGIASLRRILREAEDARLDGIPMLAVVLRCAYGGASILAGICEERLVQPSSAFGMSGPKLITQTVGATAFDAGDPAAVDELLGGTARAATSAGFRVVGPDPGAVCEQVRAWLRSPAPPPTREELLRDGATLARRLATQGTPPPAASAGALLERLAALLPGSWEAAAAADLPFATNAARPGVRALLLTATEGTDAADTLAVATALLEGADRFETTLILVDTPGHRATPADERVVLSEFLAHLALAVRLVHRGGGRVDIVVCGLGGGGTQGALGSGATSVTMTAGARLVVLPPAVLQALGKRQAEAEGRLGEALATGAVDLAFAPAA